jgi:predicted XRE-type DNA-binding protein
MVTRMKNANVEDSNAENAVVKELAAIKTLLVLLLTKSGASQAEIAKALDITQGTVSKQFRFGNVRPLTASISEGAKGKR